MGHRNKEINYLYFGSISLFLIFLSLFHFIQQEAPLFGLPLFFLLYSMGQAIFETCILVWIAYLLKRWSPRWLYFSFIAFSFLGMLLHFTQFTILRLMDAPITYLFKFLFASGIDHLLIAFAALNMNWMMTGLILGTIFSVPFFGLLFYWVTGRLSRIKPLSLSFTQITLTLTAAGLSLLFLDFFIAPFITQSTHAKYQKTLPLGTTFLSPEVSIVPLPSPLSPPRKEQETIAQIPPATLHQKPNIYFFIIETLRNDFLNSQTAPHLTRFGEEHLRVPSSFANANSTHLSWFSLLHSNFPHHWTEQRDTWEKGSIPLHYLKTLGYQIRVYTAADLSYFGLKPLLFGKELQSLDYLEDCSVDAGNPCDKDARAFAALKRDLKEHREGSVFFVFLDSTHSEYSFPPEMELPFEPICQSIDYLNIGPKSEELEKVKNRYRNAIYYVDSLFADFFAELKKEQLFDQAILSITGDHGEEFFEEGALFHGTHLNTYQIAVPILLKMKEPWMPETTQATHIDLLPTILHSLTGHSDFTRLCDGQSLFVPRKWPYRIAVMQNGPDTPSEFMIEGEKLKLRARFTDPNGIYQSSSLEIVESEVGDQPLDLTVLAPLLCAPEEILGK